MKEKHDGTSPSLPPLSPGIPVQVQHPVHGTWGGESAVVKARRPDGLSYNIVLNGTETIRNRRFLRPAKVNQDETSKSH